MQRLSKMRRAARARACGSLSRGVGGLAEEKRGVECTAARGATCDDDQHGGGSCRLDGQCRALGATRAGRAPNALVHRKTLLLSAARAGHRKIARKSRRMRAGLELRALWGHAVVRDVVVDCESAARGAHAAQRSHKRSERKGGSEG
mmetsp:Transcript_1581/g.5209  ORF Transcript_1581/g.5209 Transcript_1581/m.5209 type:complete len:147 (-) Transcript_1581:193-633(-)